MPTDDYAGGTGTTGRISIGGATTGSIDAYADADWFAILLTANVVYRFDLEGVSTSSGTLTDPILRLRDSVGTLLERDDDSGIGSNAQISYRPSSTGTYYLDVQSYNPNYTGTFTLSNLAFDDDYAGTTGTTGRVAVGGSTTGLIEVGGDVDWFAVTLNAGEHYGINLASNTLSDPWLRLYNSAGVEQLSDRYNSNGTARLSFDVTVGGTFYISAAHSYDYFNSSYSGSYIVSVISDDFRATTATTGRVSVGQSVTGTIETDGDADWFAVSLTAGYAYDFSLRGGTISDPALRLYNSSGTLIASDVYNWNGTANLTYTASQTGTFYVSAAHSYSSIYSNYTGSYTLAVGGGALTDDYAATTGTTGRVTVGGSATGVIERSGDADWFAVTLSTDERYGISVTGTTLSDPWLRIYNSVGVEQASDRYNYDGSASLTYTPTTAGTYYIAAAHSSDYSSSNTGSYTVSVLSDDYRATTATTGRVTVGESATGMIETNGDSDWFAITLSAGERYAISLTTTTLSDPWLRVYNSAGVEQASDRYNYSGSANLTFDTTAGGTYYIAAAHSYDSTYSNYTGSYRIWVLGDD